MKRSGYLLILTFALCAGLLLAALIAPAASRFEALGADDLASLSFQPHPGATLPLTAKLVDEDGRSVALGDYFTQSPVILVLDYLRCASLCGVTLSNLVGDTLHRLPLQSGRDYQLVAISIDPRDGSSDAAAARSKYAGLLGRHDSETGMHFLTGSAAAIRSIADAVGFPYRYDRMLDAYIHPAGFVVVSPEGVISRYVEGLAISPPELVAAFADARQDKSQDLLTRLVLLCHIEGAPLGRLTVPVMAALMLGNIAAGLTGIVIFAAVRRQRHG
jgi:protein SCO1